jgi:type VI secretion system protein ImpK
MANQSDAQEHRAKGAKETGEARHLPGNLPLLYEGLLTGIARLQSRRQHIQDCESFRRRTKASLQEIEQVAVTAGYDGADVREAHFAIVAFLDSVVLHSDDPVRAEWERKTLQEELFGQTDAGLVFFDKLEHFRSRRDSQQLADILEVYLLCLLLGFEGRYSGGLRGELDSITERVRRRIEDIRGPSRQISPFGALPPDPTPVVGLKDQRANRIRLAALAAVIFAILCFLTLKLSLIWTSGHLLSRLY